jgi:hypothetical protein
MLTAKTDGLVIGVIVLALAALLLVDGLLSYLNIELFSLSSFKMVVGFVLVMLSASYFRKSKE